MAETEKVKSKRDLALERLHSKYPEREFPDDEAIYGQMLDDYDAYDKENSEYKQRETALGDMMATDPRSAALLMGMKNGEDPAIGLMRRFGPELEDILHDPERQDELAGAQKDYLERVTKSRELEELYKKNFAETCDTVEKMQAEKGWSDEQVDEIMNAAIAIGNDMVVGKFTPQTIKMIAKALHYDADMEAARNEGEVAGRNTKITEQLRKAKRGDGTTPLDGKSGIGGAGKHQPYMGALERFDGPSNSVWDRGGMKRTARR